MKAQDLVVLVKICITPHRTWKYADLAADLSISQSEVFQALERCRTAGLIDATKRLVQRPQLLEFLVHGLRFVFPPTLKGRGNGTPLFPEEVFIAEGKDLQQHVYVWADGAGTAAGEAIEPLYKCIPEAIKKDRLLHKALACLEILRFQDHPQRSWAMTKLQNLLNKDPSQRQGEEHKGGSTDAAGSVTKQAILMAAAKVYARCGFEGTSLKEIATEAGVTPAMAIYHFGSKRNLILEVTRHQLQDVGKAIGGMLVLGTDVHAEHMRHILNAFIEALHTNSDFYRINLWSLGDTEPDMTEVVRPPFTFMVEHLGKNLQRLAGGSGEVDKIARGLMLVSLPQLFAITRWTYLSRIQTDASTKEILDRYRSILIDSFLTILMKKDVNPDRKKNNPGKPASELD